MVAPPRAAIDLEVPVAPVVTEAPVAPVAADAAVSEPASSELVLDFDVIATELLSVVSDKTGYPLEMLEVDQDMEADLGIDSIKRVEILGAVKELHPDLPEIEVDPQALADLRTLRQIIDFTIDLATENLDSAPPVDT